MAPAFPPLPEPEPAAGAIPAVKAAYLTTAKMGHATAGPKFVGIGMGVAYSSPDAVAMCSSNPAHKPPVWECACGFYAIGSLEELEVWRPVSGKTWELEVMLWGKVIEHDAGYRAERQRIVRARPPAWCEVCGGANTPAQYVIRQVDVLVGACERHAVVDRRAVVLAGELEEALGVPLDCAESFRTGPPVPKLEELLERLTLAVEAWRFDRGGGGFQGPPFPKEWWPILESIPAGYMQSMMIQTGQPAMPLYLEVASRGTHLELRFRDSYGYHHIVTLPYKIAGA